MTKKVLIFDDEEDILEICRFILEAKGYAVSTKQTCTDVIGDLEQVRPDVVIMDNWIPDTGGVEAIKAMKSHPRFRHIPAILFTANKEINRLSDESGADAFIAKPFDLKTMEETVERVMNGNR